MVTFGPGFLPPWPSSSVATSGAFPVRWERCSRPRREEGGYLRHSNWYRRDFKPAVATAELAPTLRFHDLRHTHVALCIAVGAHVKAIQERLGHSTVTLTLDRYGHLLPSLDEALKDRLEHTSSQSLVALPTEGVASTKQAP